MRHSSTVGSLIHQSSNWNIQNELLEHVEIIDAERITDRPRTYRPVERWIHGRPRNHLREQATLGIWMTIDPNLEVSHDDDKFLCVLGFEPRSHESSCTIL